MLPFPAKQEEKKSISFEKMRRRGLARDARKDAIYIYFEIRFFRELGKWRMQGAVIFRSPIQNSIFGEIGFQLFLKISKYYI